MMFRRKQRNKKAKDIKDISSKFGKSLDALDKVLEGHEVENSNPFYRSRSVSMDAYHFRSESTSEMKDFPSDVRKSLVALDEVLQGFEDDHKKDSRRHSVPVLRNLFGKLGLKKSKDREVPSVRNSLEVVGKVLNEYDDVVVVALRNKRSDSSLSFTPRCNEDVRRSLEILDNVLAEFDDHDIFSPSSDILVNGDEQGIPLSHAHQEKERWEDENGNKLDQSDRSLYLYSPNGDIPPEIESFGGSIDGTTSQHSSLLDESRRCSAPPVPKRSPRTRLSNRDRTFFPKEDYDDEETSHVHGSHHSLGSLQLTSHNGGPSRKTPAEGKRKAALSVPTPGTSSSSSPVNDNVPQISNRLHHGEITKPCLEFYLVRNGDDEEAGDDDVFLSPPPRDVRDKTTTCRVCGGNLNHKTSTSWASNSLGKRKVPMDATKSEEHLRRMRLEKKFAKVKLLLKTNQVTGLDKPPPSFKPPPPPISQKTPIAVKQGEMDSTAGIVNSSATWETNKTHQDSQHPTKQHLRFGCLKETHTTNGTAHSEIAKQERMNVSKTLNGLLSKDVSCADCKPKDLDNISSHRGGKLNQSSANNKVSVAPTDNRDSETVLPTDVLCQNCINRGWTYRSSELVPNPPSSLKRPPLGLSYSMEDDLSPGIKEILSPPSKTVDGQTDSLLSSPKSGSSPVTHMSTFSHSASSLGDGSSQSDLDFSTSLDSGKVPLASIKSMTLPTDMKLGPSPFYSAMEGDHVNGTDSKLGVGGLEAMRSSSAPPPLQDKGHWKKDKTGLSRKEKEKQNNNDAVDSSHQGEEEVTTDEKPKKKSVWKSILRRK